LRVAQARSESEVRRAKPTVTSRRNISIPSIFSGLPPFPPSPAAAWRPSRCYAVIGRTPRLPNRARQRATGKKCWNPNRRMGAYNRHRTASGNVRRHSRPLVRRGFCTLRPPRKTSSGSFLSAFIGVHRRPIWGFGFRVGPEKKHIGLPRCCHPVAQVALP